MSFFNNTSPVSRRKFIIDILSKVSRSILAGSSFCMGISCLCSNKNMNAHAGLFSSSLSELIKNAPTARYWLSSNSSGVNCLACHSPEEKFKGTQYNHDDIIIKCRLCAQECIIKPGKRGQCKARINIDGQLKTLVYGRPVSIHVDPIEKKPFYHFLPGASALSLATAGCPLHCKFCQNWEISQSSPEDIPAKFVPPNAVVHGTIKQNASVIAFTYNEPTVFTEYLLDIAQLGKQKNLKTALISCGFMNPEPLDDMCQVLDAIKIDLKGFDKDFYRKVCKAELDPVLRTIKQIAKSKVHLEIVNLIVPTLNDSEAMLNKLVEWIATELGPDVPVHFTRFHPDYQMLNLAPTPVATLEKAYEIAKNKGINYPYVGNVPGHSGNHTFCPGCGKPVIKRTGFFITAMNIKNGKCRYCNQPIAGVWEHC